MNGHQLNEQSKRSLRSETNLDILVSMYQSGSHSKHRLMYHLVWIPKYRKRVLSGKLAARLEMLFKQCCEINEWSLEELNIQSDHVHMIVRIKPSVSVSRAMQLLKGGSSRVIRDEFPHLEEFLWGDSFWSDGYFAETVGKIDEQIIREYVKNQ